jgi:geranylgeranyl pyrophosphate synthase
MPRSPKKNANLNLNDVQLLINERLADYAREQVSKAIHLHQAYADIWQAIGEHFTAGGKRLRPYLVALTYQSFGGLDQTSMLQVATSWELLHISMTIHDDIIDRDYKRHNHDNIAGVYLDHYAHIKDRTMQSHYANSAALLAGDLLISGAYNFINNSDFSASKRQSVVEILQEAIFVVIGGEFLDSEAATRSSLVNPLVIAEAKTASYSLIGPMLSGALLAGADKVSQQKLRELGRVLGVGYQLVDDYLGIFGDQNVTGKPTDSDLIEGKMSTVIVMSLELMSKTDRTEATKWLIKPSPEHAIGLRRLIEATDVAQHVKVELSGYKKAALEIIKQLKLSETARHDFEVVVDTLLERDS